MPVSDMIHARPPSEASLCTECRHLYEHNVDGVMKPYCCALPPSMCPIIGIKTQCARFEEKYPVRRATEESWRDAIRMVHGAVASDVPEASGTGLTDDDAIRLGRLISNATMSGQAAHTSCAGCRDWRVCQGDVREACIGLGGERRFYVPVDGASATVPVPGRQHVVESIAGQQDVPAAGEAPHGNPLDDPLGEEDEFAGSDGVEGDVAAMFGDELETETFAENQARRQEMAREALASATDRQQAEVDAVILSPEAELLASLEELARAGRWTPEQRVVAGLPRVPSATPDLDRLLNADDNPSGMLDPTFDPAWPDGVPGEASAEAARIARADATWSAAAQRINGTPDVEATRANRFRMAEMVDRARKRAAEAEAVLAEAKVLLEKLRGAFGRQEEADLDARLEEIKEEDDDFG